MTLNYKRIGQGQPVILIHGLFGNLDNLGRLAKSLSEHFDVISLDLPNHGLSSHISEFDYPLLAQIVSDFISTLGISQCHVVGHSMGGKVAMQLALDYPSMVQSLTVADIAPVQYTDRHSKVFSALNAVDVTTLTTRAQAMAVVTSCGIDNATAQFLLKNLAKSDEQLIWRCNIENLKNNYINIINGLTPNLVYTGPTLFIKGEKSDYINATHRPMIMAHFPHANAKIIQGTGHWLHAEKPASFNKIVTDFIDKNKG